MLGDDDHGPQRIELNAHVSSSRFIDFIERKLAEHGISKVIPEAAALADTYWLKRAFAATMAGLEHETTDHPPADLDERVRAYIAEHPEVPWDQAVAAIVKGDATDDKESGDAD